MINELVLYPYKTGLYLFHDGDDAIDYMNCRNHDFEARAAFTFEIINKGGIGIYVPHFSDNPRGLGRSTYIAMLSHEAVHVAEFLWEQIGEENPGTEQTSYLVEYIVDWLVTQTGVLEPEVKETTGDEENE